MSSSSHEIVLTSSPDGPIIAYDASSGTALAQFTGSRSPRRGLTIVGKPYIAASHVSPTTGSGSIHLYNWCSSSALHNFQVPEPIAPLAAMSDGAYLFAGGLSGSVHTLSIPSGDVVKSLAVHNKPVSCLGISDDESLLISGSDDGSIVVVPIFQLVAASGSVLYDNVEDLVLHRFSAHSDSVTAVVSGVGLYTSQVISCSLDGTCKFWSLLRAALLRTVVFPCAISGIALNPREPEFYAAGSDGSVYKGLWSTGRRQLVMQGKDLITWSPKHDGGVVSVVMVNEGRNLLSASEDGSVWVWQVDAGQVVMVLANKMGSISDLVAATGTNYSKGQDFRASNGGYRCDFGLPGKELMSQPVKKILKMDEMLKVAARDRSRAIEMLESAIGMYERLLELILKEAKKSSSNNKQWDEKDKKHHTQFLYAKMCYSDKNVYLYIIHSGKH